MSDSELLNAVLTGQPQPATDEALVEDPIEEEQDEAHTADDERALEADEEEIVEDEEVVDEDEETPSEEDENDTPDETYLIKVNGEEVEVSLDELVKNYSIGSTAQQRLQEATEMRKTAQDTGYTEGMNAAKEVVTAERQELDSMRQQLSGILDHVGPQLFQPLVNKPDPAMQQTDPIGYLSQHNAWQEDQARIMGLQQQLEGTAQQIAEHQEALQAKQFQTEQIALRQKRPDLAEPEKVKEFTTSIRAAQDAFGFTQAEIDAFPDHRALLVLEAAGKYMAMMNGTGETKAQRVVKKAGKTLKPGGVAVQSNQKQKARRVNLERAKKTGSVSDVAKTLFR